MQQFLTYLVRAAQGNLGTSIYFGVPVTQLILQHFPVTLLLTCLSMFCASRVGILLGVIAADRRDTPVDAIVSGASLVRLFHPDLLARDSCWSCCSRSTSTGSPPAA